MNRRQAPRVRSLLRRNMDGITGGPMTRIKKYGNRRLYNTETSKYMNMEELGALVRGGELVEVVDATSGEDLTRAVLLQLIVEDPQGAAMFPVGLLHRIVRSVGAHPGQRWMMAQLGQALSLLDAQLTAAEAQFPWLKAGTWAQTGTWAQPGTSGATAPPEPESAAQAPGPEPAEPPPEGRAGMDAELDALRARLAGLEARLKK